MSKIFLVTDGEYSDYHVEGAFSLKRKAEDFISKFGGEVKEILVDELENTRQAKVFYCYINLKSGAIYNEGEFISRIKNRTRRLIKRQKCNNADDTESILVESIQSKEHARKCATEARQKYLRNGKKWENSFDINLGV